DGDQPCREEGAQDVHGWREGAASGGERAEAQESCDGGAQRGAPRPQRPPIRFTRLGAHLPSPLGDPTGRLIVESRKEIIARGASGRATDTKLSRRVREPLHSPAA